VEELLSRALEEREKKEGLRMPRVYHRETGRPPRYGTEHEWKTIANRRGKGEKWWVQSPLGYGHISASAIIGEGVAGVRKIGNLQNGGVTSEEGKNLEK